MKSTGKTYSRQELSNLLITAVPANIVDPPRSRITVERQLFRQEKLFLLIEVFNLAKLRWDSDSRFLPSRV